MIVVFPLHEGCNVVLSVSVEVSEGGEWLVFYREGGRECWMRFLLCHWMRPEEWQDQLQVGDALVEGVAVGGGERRKVVVVQLIRRERVINVTEEVSKRLDWNTVLLLRFEWDLRVLERMLVEVVDEGDDIVIAPSV